MNRRTSAIPISLALSLAFAALAPAQDGRGRGTLPETAVPWTGPAPTRETVSEMMARQAITPEASPRIMVRELQGPFLDKRQNPNALPGSSYGMDGPARRSRDVEPLYSIPLSFTAATLNDTNSFPPDTQGDVGPEEILVTVNGRFRSFSKTGVQGAMNLTPETFFAGQRTANTGTSDPRVRFDRISQRWFIVMIDVKSADNKVLLAVSDGPRITASTVWTKYGFTFSAAGSQVDVGRFMDYPTLGVDANAIYVGAIIFGSSGYTGNTALVIRKSPVLTGGALVVSAFRNIATSADGPFVPQGVSNDDPAATQGYFIGPSAIFNGKLILRRITDPAGTPTMSANLDVAVPNTASPSSVTVPGGAPLDAIDDRLLAAKFHTDKRTGVRRIYTTHSIRVNSTGVADGSGGRNGIRWYEVDALAATPTLSRSGTIFDSAASAPLNYWMGDVALNGIGDVVIGGSVARSTTRPGVAVAFLRQGTTVPVTTNAVPGLGDYTNSAGRRRWGDYSLTVVDPADEMTVWTFQMRTVSNNLYGVEVVKVLTDVPPTPTTLSRTSIRRGQTVTVTVDGTGPGIYFEPGVSTPNHLAAAFAGLTVTAVRSIAERQIEIDVAAPAGATLGGSALTVTNPDGQTATLADALTVRATAPVTVTPALASFVGTPTGLAFSVQIRNASTGAVLETLPGTLDASGRLIVDSLLPAGSYTFSVKGGTFLRRNVAGTLTDDGALVTPSMVNGDVDGDNVVGASDLSRVNARQGATVGSPNYQAASDVNGSGTIDATDAAIVRSNLRVKGDL